MSVCVGTYGDPEWVTLAQTRAVPSVGTQAPVIHVHADTLANARNAAVAKATTEWVVCLDADDELRPGYIDTMATGTADVRAPAVEYIVHGRPRPARVPNVAGHSHRCRAECLPEGNWLVIGSAVRRDMVLDVGGFRDFTWSEDWDLWLRCYLAGATFQALPDAVYRAHVRPGSRNRSPSREDRNAVHQAIHRANYPHLYEPA